MRAVVQRVERASVSIDGECVGAIGRGFLVLLGVGASDTEATGARLLDKLLRLRIFADEAGKTNLDIRAIEGSLLIVSQFTLYADCKRGNRPSFTAACAPAEAERLYECFVAAARTVLGEARVQTGRFAADMQVTLTNDGPFTILLDTDVL